MSEKCNYNPNLVKFNKIQILNEIGLTKDSETSSVKAVDRKTENLFIVLSNQSKTQLSKRLDERSISLCVYHSFGSMLHERRLLAT